MGLDNKSSPELTVETTEEDAKIEEY